MIAFYYKANTFKITFAVDGAVFETMEIRKNTSIRDYPKPEKEGYAFIGWYDKDGNLLESSTVVNENLVFYARWAEIVTEDEDNK